MYKVGQVLYVLSNTKMQVIPVRVVKEVTEQTMTGKNVSYAIETPATAGTDKLIELSKIKGTVFTSIESARKKMMENASIAIDGIITKAKRAEKVFKPVSNEDESNSLYIEADEVDQLSQTESEKYEAGSELAEEQRVVLDDGTIARLKMSDDVKSLLSSPTH